MDFFQTSFVANSAQSTIALTAITPSTGTMGNFLDDVKVVESTLSPAEISAPATIALSLAVFLTRKHKSISVLAR